MTRDIECERRIDRMIGSGSLIIGYDKSDTDDSACLIIGKKLMGQEVVILNAIQGQEAIELYDKLVTPKNTEKHDK